MPAALVCRVQPQSDRVRVGSMRLVLNIGAVLAAPVSAETHKHPIIANFIQVRSQLCTLSRFVRIGLA